MSRKAADPLKSSAKLVARMTARSAITKAVPNPLLAALAVTAVNFFIRKLK